MVGGMVMRGLVLWLLMVWRCCRFVRLGDVSGHRSHTFNGSNHGACSFYWWLCQRVQ